MKIVIVGAGIIGVTTAYELALRGQEVTLLDRREGAGLETSYANGGQIGASEVAPWAGPDVPLRVLRWLGRADAPFRLRLRPDPEQWLWLLRFLLRCRASAQAERVPPNLALALLTRARMEEIQETLAAAGEPIAFDERRDGILQIFHGGRELQAAARLIEPMREAGLEQNILDAHECVAVEPALADAAKRGGIAGGIYSPSDRSGDAHLFTARLAAHAERMGVRFLTGREAGYFEFSGGRIAAVHAGGMRIAADAVVLAAGTGTVRLARRIGLRLPVYPVKGYSVTLPAIEGASPFVSLTDEARRIVVSRLGTRLRVAGTAEIGGYDTTIEMARARSVLAALLDLFPAMQASAGEAVHWCGLRPMTPDGSPVIGRVEGTPNLFLNTGHGTLGWTLGAGSAAALADLICGASPRLDLSSFSIKRFSFF